MLKKQIIPYIYLKNKKRQNNRLYELQINEDVVPFVIKNFLNKKTIYNQPINSVKFIIDELPMQVWTLKNETIVCLLKGYNYVQGTSLYSLIYRGIIYY